MPRPSNGSPISGYTVTAADSTTSANGGETCTTTGALNCIVTGLTNGDSYTFTVTATNGIGTGPSSSPSSPVTPAAVTRRPDRRLGHQRAERESKVTWSAAPSNGSPISGYTVTAADSTTSANGGETCTTTGALNCIVTGLTNGDSYTFTVTATNGIGTGPSSSPSSPVTPAASPGAPTGVSATNGQNASSKVTWSAAPSNGSPISGYTVTAADSTTSANGGRDLHQDPVRSTAPSPASPTATATPSPSPRPTASGPGPPPRVEPGHPCRVTRRPDRRLGHQRAERELQGHLECRARRTGARSAATR